MILLFFCCTDPSGHYHECSLSGFDLEVCMESVTILVQQGWLLHSIKVVDNDNRSIFLPAEAFDGQSLFYPIQQIQKEWETILFPKEYRTPLACLGACLIRRQECNQKEDLNYRA